MRVGLGPGGLDSLGEVALHGLDQHPSGTRIQWVWNFFLSFPKKRCLRVDLSL